MDSLLLDGLENAPDLTCNRNCNAIADIGKIAKEYRRLFC